MKRALSLGNDHQLVMAIDTDINQAKKVAKQVKCPKVSDDPSLLYDKCDNVDLVIVSTINDSLANLTLEAVNHGKHVLVEKPAARTPEELVPIIKTAKKNKVFVKVGFNHRFHPAILKASGFIKAGALDELMFIRGRYGHGGRLGYEKEWRADPLKSGGGELIDQGVHLIDLSRWFLGDLDVINSYAHTYFWDMPVEDNAFLMLKSPSNKVAWLHVSCTEWKNLFSFEIYGKKGKIIIDGLGGSYGTETMTYHRMYGTMGVPDTGVWKFDSKTDESWKKELDYFTNCIQHRTQPEGNITDAKKALDIVQKVYCNQQQ
jgi:predicted dehydrogenase